MRPASAASAASAEEREPLLLSRAQTVALIRAYGERRHLWDSAHAAYFSRALRAREWRRVARRLALPDAAVPLLKKRIESLLGSYRREKSRERQSIASGLGPDKVYKSKWYGYEHFHFMSEKTVAGAPPPPYHGDPGARITHEPPAPHVEQTIKMEFDAYEDEEYVVNENEHEPECEEEPAPARECAACAGGAGGAGGDASLAFGLYVASEVRKYAGAAAARLKHAIHNVIFEADLAAAAAAAAACSADNCTSATSEPTEPTT